MDITIYPIFCAIALAYLSLVKSLRWRRYDAIHQKYRSRYEEKTLTPEEAQHIIHVGAFYDMPALMGYAMGFAMYKTYAIVGRSSFKLFTRQ